MVEFVVDKTGAVTDIRPLTYHGFGMEQEVINLLKKSPKWEPAIVLMAGRSRLIGNNLWSLWRFHPVN